MADKTIPGTTIEYSQGEGMFSRLKPLMQATDGLTLGQVCAITGLESSTIQNWVKRKFVARPVNKKYHERQLARILLISSLRDAMKIENIGELMHIINGNTDDESDDIISEENLYDYFCEIIGKTKSTMPSIEEIPPLVKEVIKNYKAPFIGAQTKLYDALTVMVYAYTAAEYKKIADNKFNSLKEELK